MAGKEDLDLDLSENEEGGGKSKMLIFVIIGVVLLGGGVGAFFLLGGDGGDGSDKEVKAEEVAPVKETLFVTIPNAIVVNIPGGKKGRVLQAKVSFQVNDVTAEAAVKEQLPLLTNKILTYLSGVHADKIMAMDEKKALKDELLESLRTVMKERTQSEQIEKVLFTSFVMQ